MTDLRPVSLTIEQINGILNEIPSPPGIGKTALSIARGHLVNNVRMLLEDIKLVPLEEAYQEFKDELIQSLYESYIEPGSSVGITAGVSLGGPATQLSLNSFHFAGSQSGVALAFQKVRDFLTGSKMNRSPQMKVYFKVPYVGSDLHDTLHTGSFNSIMSLRHEFEQTMVSDVIASSQILNQQESEMAGIPQLIALHSRLRPERFAGNVNRFPLTYTVELRLNTYRMYTHKITMAMIAKAIEGPIPPDALTCVWRSQIDGRMYILVDESRGDYGQQAMNPTMAILMFLDRDIRNKFKQWKISGITGIVSIEPQEVNVMKSITRIKTSRKMPTTHYIYTNNRRTRWDGVSLADIHRLVSAAGFKVRPLNEKSKEKLYIIVDDFSGRFEDELNRRIRISSDKSPNQRTPSDIALINATTFHYALTTGTNMEEIVWRDDIDLFRTASNHSHEIADMLGIDAARIFLIFRFMQTLQDFSSYVNPRHISLTFDLLCNLGIINSLSFVGINRRRIGPLAMASYERSLDVFVNSSVFGDKEAVVGVSPSIYVGQRSKRVGTTSIALEEDLTVIPQDQPTLPTIDEDTTWDDVMEDENVIEGTALADLMANEDIQQTRILTSAPIDKSRILNRTMVTNQPPQPVVESIVPAGGQVILASQTLLRALEKVTNNTGITIETHESLQQVEQIETPNFGETLLDITSLDDLTGLTLTQPQRAQAQPPSTNIDILSTLQSVRNPMISNEQIPTLSPPPNVRVPNQPQSLFEPITTTVPLSPGSFINLLPDITDVIVPYSERGNVNNISVSDFGSRLSTLQQNF